jgi:hypothetical protein
MMPKVIPQMMLSTATTWQTLAPLMSLNWRTLLGMCAPLLWLIGHMSLIRFFQRSAHAAVQRSAHAANLKKPPGQPMKTATAIPARNPNLAHPLRPIAPPLDPASVPAHLPPLLALTGHGAPANQNRGGHAENQANDGADQGNEAPPNAPANAGTWRCSPPEREGSEEDNQENVIYLEDVENLDFDAWQPNSDF